MQLPSSRSSLGFLAATLLSTTLIHAVDISWIGSNSNTGNASIDVNDPANWSTTSVPGSSDTAIFNYVGASVEKADIFITTADTLFDPNRLEFNSNVDPSGFAQSNDLYIDKSLTLTNGLQISSFGATGGSGQQASRFQVGTASTSTKVSIDLPSFTFTGQAPGWSFFILGNGDGTSGTASEMNFTGSSITFATPNNNLGSSLSGGVSQENVTNDISPVWNFTTSAASIDLQNAGQRSTGAIGFGLVRFAVRSDQTWTADPTAFITMAGSNGATGSGGSSGKYLVESITGARLDNLDALNIKLTGTASSNTLNTAMRLMGGEYGSLWMQGDSNTVSRNQYVKLTGDTSLKAASVFFDGSNNPYASEYGLVVSQVGSGTNQTDNNTLYTQGFALTVENGLLLNDASSSSTVGRALKLDAQSSTVNIEGNVLMTGDASKLPGGANVNNSIGIEGGILGTNLTVGGSWEVRNHSATGTGVYNLSSSTYTMNGGTTPSAVLFEVGDEASATGVQTQTWSVGIFNVGVDSGDTAHVKLVNNYLNNNTFVSDPNVDKIGEKLIAGTLNIRQDSILDANLGAASVEVASLLLESGAVLDLNTNLVLTDGQNIAGFVGLGDLTATWNTFAGQVIDSSNPLFAFSAVYLGGPNQTLWQAALVPEPGTWALIAGIATLGFCLIRRRRQA